MHKVCFFILLRHSFGPFLGVSEKRIDKKKISRQARDDNDGGLEMTKRTRIYRMKRIIRAIRVIRGQQSLAIMIHSFSRSPEKRNQKRGATPQGPLDRGMQTKGADARRLSCLFGIAGHAMSFFFGWRMRSNMCSLLSADL